MYCWCLNWNGSITAGWPGPERHHYWLPLSLGSHPLGRPHQLVPDNTLLVSGDVRALPQCCPALPSDASGHVISFIPCFLHSFSMGGPANFPQLCLTQLTAVPSSKADLICVALSDLWPTSCLDLDPLCFCCLVAQLLKLLTIWALLSLMMIQRLRTILNVIKHMVIHAASWHSWFVFHQWSWCQSLLLSTLPCPLCCWPGGRLNIKMSSY